MTKQNNRMQIDSMQLTIPRARRRHFYNLRHSGYLTPLVSGRVNASFRISNCPWIPCDKPRWRKKMAGVCCSSSRSRREQSSCLAARKVLRILAIYSFVILYSISIEMLFVSWKHFIRSPFELHGKMCKTE